MTDSTFDLIEAGYSYPCGQCAVGSISLNIAQGEQVAILGANASGKSTLLRLMDGLLFPSSGIVRAFGKDLSEKTMDGTKFGLFFRQQVAFLFQNIDAQLFCSSVEDEIAFGPRHLGMSIEDTSQRVQDMISMFDLAELRNRPPQTLSGGEKRRVGLAAALAVGPSVLLLDEPTTGLDPRNQAFLVDTLLALADAGKTLIIATHDLELARDVTNRSVVLSEDHRVAADGPTDIILSNVELLAGVNLIHVHPHRHGRLVHTHPHTHVGPHGHGSED